MSNLCCLRCLVFVKVDANGSVSKNQAGMREEKH